MKIKPSSITCQKSDFLEALDSLQKNKEKSNNNEKVRKIISLTKYFAKKFGVIIDDNFNPQILIEKLKNSDDFEFIGLREKIEEILGYNSGLEKHYFEALDKTSMLLKVSIDGKILWANQNFLDKSGYNLEEIIGLKIKKLSGGFFKEKQKEFLENLRNTILSGNIWSGNIKNKTKDGLFYWTKTTIIPKITNGKIDYFTVLKTDITEIEKLKTDLQRMDDLRNANIDLAKKNSELFILSITDPLTKLYNKRAFEERFEQEFLKSKRYKTNLSLILFDVDYFKKINDTYGHDIGDAVLKLVADELRIITRDTDLKFRIGGEEFAIILTGETLEQTKILAEKIRNFFDNLEISGLPNFTLSLGISFLDQTNLKDFSNKEELFKIADKALYLAKKSGRNCVKTMKDI